MADPLADIYSPENIARSRGRAAWMRAAVERGELGREWLNTAAEVDAYADERAAHAAATDRVLDGLACTGCGAESVDMLPDGFGERGQLFRCAEHDAERAYA